MTSQRFFLFALATALCIVFGSQKSLSQTIKATITPIPSPYFKQTIPPELFGSFIEFIWDTMNGPFGMYAEEILHRGFDRKGKYEGISENWQPFGDTEVISATTYRLDSGGYNKRGVYAQTIIRNDSSQTESGIAQDIVINGNVPHTFYVYARGTAQRASMKIISTDEKDVLFSKRVQIDAKDVWQKTTVTVPPVPISGRAKVVFSFSDAGILQLDEASLMPDDNIAGIRSEYAEFYKELAPPLLRYPGGCFSDQNVFQWEYGIGDRDQRCSPLIDWVGDYQRMDFGTDEYMAFCKYIGAKPQLTINFGSSTPQDAANYIEYCNGSVDTKFGAIRAANGHPDPYNVQYVEIGNEQYGIWEVGHTTPDLYAKRAVEFSQAIKAVSPDIISIFNGDTWSFSWNDSVIRNAQPHIDMFSLHLGTGYGIDDSITSDDFWYTMLVSDSKFLNMWMELLKKAVTVSGLLPNQKIALTEWWHKYNGNAGLYHDPRFGSLSSGLWNALTYLHFINLSNFYSLANRTSFVGLRNCCINPKTNARFLYKTPGYYAALMLRPLGGGELLPLDIQSPSYNFEGLDGIPYIAGSAAYKSDSIYIALVNRHPDSAISVQLYFDSASGAMRRTVLNSEKYSDINNPNNPERIKPETDYLDYSGYVTLPPHSFTTLTFASSINSNQNVESLEFDAQLFPQPTQGTLEAKIKSNKYLGEIVVEFYDVLGHIVASQSRKNLDGRDIILRFDVSKLPSGQYYARIMAGEHTLVRPFAVVY
ncbi:hypothetical protein MASR2M18_06290 [Ignavibacteria bacterium]|jgi:alpha-N-arabinofuranosidase|nr:hypothetical protein [Bacteroidota bacterium]